MAVNLVSLLAAAMLAGCSSNTESLLIIVEPRYCGKVYLIESARADSTTNTIVVNRFGVGYVPIGTFKHDRRPTVIRANEFVTNLARYIIAGNTNAFPPREVRYGQFYIACPDEISLGDDYWEQRYLKDIQMDKLGKMVKSGEILLDQ